MSMNGMLLLKGGITMGEETTNERLNKEKGIYTDFKKDMTYGDYLHLDTLLSSQHPLSDHHDETLFIIIHQVSELWMKLILHEMNAAIRSIQHDDIPYALKVLARVNNIQDQLIQGWNVLSTLTPKEYIEFRNFLGKSSGFQSHQYRMMEFALGYKTKHILHIYKEDKALHEKLSEAFHAPSVYDVTIEAMRASGLDINEQLSHRDFSVTYTGDDSVKAAWKHVYLNSDTYWELYELAEKLVDVEDKFQQWRFRHMKTVERIIGFKKGTGGSSGVKYLKNVLEHSFFPELWDLRTEL